MLLFYVFDCFSYMVLCAPTVCSTLGVEKMTLEPLELVMSHYVGDKVLMRELREVGGREG